MTTLLLNENKPTPVTDALAELDVRRVHNDWCPDDATLDDTVGCLVSFYDCLSRPLDIWRLRRRLAPRRIPLIAWNRDAPGYLNKQAWRLNLLARCNLLDIYLSHALPDGRRFAETMLLFPNGVRVDTYNLRGVSLESLRDIRNYRYDVSFFGAFHTRRSKDYLARERFFAVLESNLAERNIRYRFIDSQDEVLSYPDQVAFFQQSRINLNFGAGCDRGDETAWGLPERCFGIPACGGFQISDRRRHAAASFDPLTEWVEFDGVTDALDKIDYFLAHFDESRAIAEAAHARVMACHTYRRRAEELLAIVADWRQRKQ